MRLPHHLVCNSKRSLFLWNLMIRASTRDGEFTGTLEIYSSMFKSGVCGSNFTFPLILKACGKLGSLRDGTKVHAHTFLMGYDNELFVQTALIDMYGKCSNLAASRQLFDEMPVKSLISWNSMISAYCNYSLINESFKLLKQMQVIGLQPSLSTFVSIVSSCSGSGSAIWHALLIHCYSIKLGLDSDLHLSNSIMSMYVKRGDINAALSIFYSMAERSVVSWTTIIGWYVDRGNIAEAFDIFKQMRKKEIGLDSVVFIYLTSGCLQVGTASMVSSVHALILKTGCNYEEPIQSSLISMYANCGDLISAQRVFNLADQKSIVLWTSMIGGYVYSGHPSEALNLFKNLLMTSIRPNKVTLVTVLAACANLGALSVGEEVVGYIMLNGLESDLCIQTALIHMYCKCGSIMRAKEVFDRVPNKDLAVWSSMINGYAIHGRGEEALNLFLNMQKEEGIKPDAVVYTTVLSACSHLGLVDDGLKYFHSMQRDYGLEPNIEHYSCLVDLLGRAGYLDLALKTIQEMPLHAQKAQVWAPLLSACRTHHNIQLGEFVAKKLFVAEPQTTCNYILLANTYTSVGKWTDAAAMRRLINEKGMVKEAGWSQIEVNNSV
ncbi:pentatricopeptide repeat-containing protein DOT4, chloroplastic-like [Macadamia integrifolia]|uniref:pentatricopeptide repeat-containing protein DOT4, chloroplastic-like n=1 Tax=Macadamia integrifolia TaxID=60698 RepID=UPI001C50153E|nr:pentatricopeptide repeat-containing protein DOT4, chloroplastic-like [Macadamia integrifolia]XP_042488707.1 pentatricopeptide repeat-containing protein DOT4, chloroplastic-like [Macadamia integrifolia]